MKNIFLAVLGGIVGEETYYERLYQKTKCQNIMWNGEQIPFAVEEDGTKFRTGTKILSFLEFNVNKFEVVVHIWSIYKYILSLRPFS